MAANGGIRETYNRQSQDFMEPKIMEPVREAQLAVLELIKQPEGRNVSWLIKMFGGIHHHVKESLSQRISYVQVSLVAKEE